MKVGRPANHDLQLARSLGMSKRAVERLGGYAKLSAMPNDARETLLNACKRITRKNPSIAVQQPHLRRKRTNAPWLCPSCGRDTRSEICDQCTERLRSGCTQRTMEAG